MAKILIIDDDVLNSKIFSTKLEAENNEVVFCSDGNSAKEKLQNKYDVILLDIMVPQIDGITLLDEAKKGINSSTSVIVLTNLLSEDTKKQCLDKGAKEYLIKADFTPTQLLEKLRNYLPAPATSSSNP